MKKAIVAYDRNRAIGANNTLPWMGRMKDDMLHVRDLTKNQAIIMGRKTFESIGRALPDRQNIVITSHDIDIDDVHVVRGLDDAYAVVEAGRDAIIFGGGQIYALALDTIDEVLATEIDTIIESADAFFPELGDEWHEVSREHHDANDENAFAFDFVIYRRQEAM